MIKTFLGNIIPLTSGDLPWTDPPQMHLGAAIVSPAQESLVHHFGVVRGTRVSSGPVLKPPRMTWPRRGYKSMMVVHKVLALCEVLAWSE